MATELSKRWQISIQLKGVVDYRLGRNRVATFSSVAESLVYCKAWLAEEKKRERFAKMENNFVTPRTANNKDTKHG